MVRSRTNRKTGRNLPGIKKELKSSTSTPSKSVNTFPSPSPPHSHTNGTNSNPSPSLQSLLTKTSTLLAQQDYPLASRFIDRILELDPLNGDAIEWRGVVCLESGDLGGAGEAFTKLLSIPSPSPSPNNQPSSNLPQHQITAHLHLAQLSEDPHQAIRHYQAAVDGLVGGRIRRRDEEEGMNLDDDSGREEREREREEEEEKKRTAIRALVSMVEIYMSDLCFEPTAEQSCETYLSLGLELDPNSAEALASLASVRISQNRNEEAKEFVLRSWEVWKRCFVADGIEGADADTDKGTMKLGSRLDLDQETDTPTPLINNSRVGSGSGNGMGTPGPGELLSLARTSIELGMYGETLEILQIVFEMDEEEVEGWYLQGWCFVLMGEGVRSGETTVSGEEEKLGWEEMLQDARDCLETCRTLHRAQEHGDESLLGHVEELIGELDRLGIQSSSSLPVVGGTEEEEEWEECSDSNSMNE